MGDADRIEKPSSLLGRLEQAACTQGGFRLGIMGGTFDPVHFGHLLCAERAREAFSLDLVLFMPAGVPSYKRGKVVASPTQRLEMCSLAVSDNPLFDVSDMEIAREGTTYTVDTLAALAEAFSGHVELFFITGSDSLKTIADWRDSSRMRSLATFIGVSRPGYSFDSDKIEKEGFPFELLQIDALHISSSDIRERLSAGHTVRYLLPAQVLSYIDENGLYRAGAEAVLEPSE